MASPGPLPRCKCGDIAVLRTVRTEGGNCGREFYCCPSSDRQCGYFLWKPTLVSPAESRRRAAEASSIGSRVAIAATASGIAGAAEDTAVPRAAASPPALVSRTGPIPAAVLMPVTAAALAVPHALWERLYEFQRDAVRFVVAHAGRALIADEMGLGKTKSAIAAAANYAARWPLLVLCPSSLRLNWRDELLESLFGLLDDCDITVVKTGKDSWPPPAASRGRGLKAGVVLMSYDMVSSFVGEGRLRPGDFSCIVVDESHALKTRDSQRTVACMPLVQSATVALLLTGTPALNRPRELFPQVAMVRPTLFPHYEAFATRFCAARMAPWGYDDSGCSNPAELQAVLSREVMIRRLKSDVLSALPSKHREFVTVPLTPSAAKDISKLQAEETLMREQQRAAASPAQAEEIGNRIRGLQNKAYSATGCGKLPAVVSQVVEAIYLLRPELHPRRAVESNDFLTRGTDPVAGSKRPRAQLTGSAPLSTAAAAAPAGLPVLCSGRKVLIFAHHTEVITAIEAALLAHRPPIRCVRFVARGGALGGAKDTSACLHVQDRWEYDARSEAGTQEWCEQRGREFGCPGQLLFASLHANAPPPLAAQHFKQTLALWPPSSALPLLASVCLSLPRHLLSLLSSTGRRAAFYRRRIVVRHVEECPSCTRLSHTAYVFLPRSASNWAAREESRYSVPRR